MAKQTNLPIHWIKFRNLRNRVIQLIHEPKRTFICKMANKQRSDLLSSKQLLKFLKSLIAPHSKTFIPPLEKKW